MLPVINQSMPFSPVSRIERTGYSDRITQMQMNSERLLETINRLSLEALQLSGEALKKSYREVKEAKAFFQEVKEFIKSIEDATTYFRLNGFKQEESSMLRDLMRAVINAKHLKKRTPENIALATRILENLKQRIVEQNPSLLRRVIKKLTERKEGKEKQSIEKLAPKVTIDEGSSPYTKLEEE